MSQAFWIVAYGIVMTVAALWIEHRAASVRAESRQDDQAD